MPMPVEPECGYPEDDEGKPEGRFRRQGESEEQLLVSFHLKDAVAKDPLEKIRLTCEAYQMVKDNARLLKLVNLDHVDTAQMHKIYALSLAFYHARIFDQFIAIPWPFPQTDTYYRDWIRPWHISEIAYRWTNSAMKAEKEQKLERLAEWQRFFKITTELDLSPVSLQMLRTEFIVWAMPYVMQIYSALSAVFAIDFGRG